MMTEWKKYTLQDLATIKYGKNQKDVVSQDGTIPIFGTGGLMGYATKPLYSEPSVLIGRKGTIEKVRYVTEPFWTVDTLFYTIINNDLVTPYFFYCLMQLVDLKKLNEGTTIPSLRTDTLNRLVFNIPPLSTQKKIAEVLSCLDAKIELNRRINENLKQQAGAIFKEWFVDNAKPEWKKGNLLDIADYLNGLAMQKFPPMENEIDLPVLKIKELRQTFCDDSSDRCSSNINEKYIINDGDVIFSWSGTLLLDFWCGGKCGLNQHLFKVTSDKFNKWFYYCWTNYHLEKFIHVAADKATTMGHIKRDELEKSEVLIPDEETYRKGDKLIAPLYSMIISNRVENRKLAEIRDTMLPKLMNGELEV